MSAEDAQNDYRFEVLRAAGHGDAADLLAKLPNGTSPEVRQEEEEKPAALPDSEGHALLEGMRAAGVLGRWRSGGRL